MKLLEKLLDNLDDDAPVRSVLVGVNWTLVCSRRCGLASTFKSNNLHGHDAVRDVGSLQGKSARELAHYALSDNLLEVSIGMAALNSMLDFNFNNIVEINASEVLARHGRDKRVALVGHFPFIPQLRNEVGELWVLELQPDENEYHSESAPDIIPRADVVAITSSAFINHTMDNLLALCPPTALVMLLGPTTPLTPLLFDYNISLISGSRVVDEAAAIRTVSQGANFRQVQGVKLITISSDSQL